MASDLGNTATEQCDISATIALDPWPAPMRVVDHSFANPADNLAYDELLLDDAESGRGAATLRIWESPRPFIVLGVSQVLREHVNVAACIEGGVSILRRSSAGGCVMQGPGSINFALVLSHERFPEIGTIRGSYCFILGRLMAALRERGINASHKGTSDLAVSGKKISGNAQRRRKRFILHHGTLLYDMDPELMEHYLIEPDDRPQYRGQRTHRGFVKCLPLTSNEIRDTFLRAFAAPGTQPDTPTKTELSAVKALAKERFETQDWINRR